MKEQSEATQRCLRKAAKTLLEGVGEIPSELMIGKTAIHYRRSLTVEEREQLSPGWRAIEPTDEAGEGIVLEVNT